MSESPYEQFCRERAAEIAAQGSDLHLANLTQAWIERTTSYKYSYHSEWLGRPIIQFPQDVVAMQELVWRVRPSLIIETGIAHGGSVILSASLLALLDMCDALESQNGQLDLHETARKVVAVDIDIRAHNQAAIRAHPLSSRIEMIQGSSVDPSVVERIRIIARRHEKVLIYLDSTHTHDHVLAELDAYAPLVTLGSYCIVFDTLIERMPASSFSDRPWGPSNNPMTAVREWLPRHPEFKVDESIEQKLLVTVAPNGYLRRIS